MDFHSLEWRSEALSKTFIPGSPEDKRVEKTMTRIRHLLGTTGKEKILMEIVNVALFDAQKLLVDRIDPNLSAGVRA